MTNSRLFRRNPAILCQMKRLRACHLPVGTRRRSSTLDDVQANTVLAFLEHIESKRGNSAITRNCRLAAVRSFVQYLLRHDVTRAGQYGTILAIKTKRATRRTVTYLEPEEARA